MNKESLSNISRLEVIDGFGRSYVRYFKKGLLEFSLQDEGRTLKIFINEESSFCEKCHSLKPKNESCKECK